MKIAVVTGANRGLGKGTAEELAKRGYLVFMLGRDAGQIEKAAAELQEKKGTVRPFVLDVTDAEGPARLAETIRKEFGKLDVLVNNAGVFLEGGNDFDAQSGSVFKASPETVCKTFEINTVGPLRLIQALMPLLEKSEAGRIVNVSSGMGSLAEMAGAWPGYRLSKTALNALTRVVAAELRGSSVKINSVCPGWVRTDMGGAGAARAIPEGVASIVWAATLGADGPTGGFFRDGKKVDW